jgi:hypothetical protein
MAEGAYQRQAGAAGQRTKRSPAEPVVVLLLIAAAFVAGWRARRGWHHMTGYSPRGRR